LADVLAPLSIPQPSFKAPDAAKEVEDVRNGWETRIGKEFVPDSIKESMEKRTNWGGF
jgi:hypothetical protein